MPIIDIAIIAVIAFFGIIGLWKGLIRTLLSIVAAALAIVAAYFFNDALATWLAAYIPWADTARESLAFLFILVVVNRAVSFIFWLADKLFGFLWRLPFINSLNRLLGMLFGAVEGAIIVGVVFAFLIAHPPSAWIIAHMAGSTLVPMLAPIGAAVLPSISGVTEQLETLQGVRDVPVSGADIITFISSTIR